MLQLLPMPKIVNETTACLSHSTIKPVSFPADTRIDRALAKLPLSPDGVALEICLNGFRPERYALKIEAEKITLLAGDARGIFYAIQTLRQLFEHRPVPCLYIEDEPDFAHRAFYHDVTRGKVPTVETLKELIDRMAYFKMNSLQLYVEHTFAFEEYADSIARTGYLTKDEIRELDRYCTENFIEFIPSLSTFGHLYELLQKERYKELCELTDYRQSEHFWLERMTHHTIDPTNPKSFDLIKSLIDQYLPLFSSDKFNICCDETFDLYKGRHKGDDIGRLYTEFVAKIANYIQSKGKTVLMWADVLLAHLDKAELLPDGVVFLNWEYESNPSEGKVKAIAATRRPQIVCPGTSSWNRFVENIDVAEANISRMAEYGAKHGALGMLNTNWGDYGNPCSLELAMYGLAVGAEKAWSVKTVVDEDFRKTVNRLLYQNDSAFQTLRLLCDMNHRVNWMDFVRCLSNHLYSARHDIHYPTQETVRCIQSDYVRLQKTLSAAVWNWDECRQEMLLCAEAITVMAEILGRINGDAMERVTSTEEFLGRYRQKWLQKNKASELCEIENAFRTMEKLAM